MRKAPVLSDEQRQARRETILRTKPWTKATGPKTVEGKAASAQRWRRHGLRSEEAKVALQWVRSVQELVLLLGRRGVICVTLIVVVASIPSNIGL